MGNRGLARRTVFESGRDVAVFLDLLARVSRQGNLEVHAYVFMTNHFHLLARSPRGSLSRAMWAVENEYVRYFNRGRDRDGPLFRSRFWSRIIETGPYWHSVLRYIDRNPVSAGMAATSVDHPHGSARWYAKGGGPPCLRKDVVSAVFGLGAPGPGGSTGRYPVEVPGPGAAALDEFVETRMRRSDPGEDPVGRLVGAPRSRIAEWMLRAARTADGSTRFPVLVSPAILEEVCNRRGDDTAFLAAMLHHCCGLTLSEVAARIGSSPSTVQRQARAHRDRLESEDGHRERAAAVLEAALERNFGGVRELPA